MDKLAVNIVEAAQAAGVSRSTLYDEIRRGRLQVRKIGRRTVVSIQELKSWLEAKPHTTHRAHVIGDRDSNA